MPAPIADLSSPDTFVPGVPHETFARLRSESPVYWHETPRGTDPGFFAVTRYEDLKTVSGAPEIFSSARGGITLETYPEATLEVVRRILIYMDPPDHRHFRRVVSQHFTPRAIQGLLPNLRKLARKIVADVIEKGECEFVTEVAAQLPMAVICELMGVDREDRPHIQELTDRMIGKDDPDFATTEVSEQEAQIEMFGYAARLAERARRSPREDLASRLLGAEVDGRRMSPDEFNAFFLLLAVAGNETTRTVTCHGMHRLIEHPAQMWEIQRNPALLPGAIEEMLRFDPPVLQFRRTAQHDTELRGVEIAEGEPVVMWYPSANRDEAVFRDPDDFDIHRQPNHHLAFGVGEHFCLGAHLARMELLVIFQELLDRMTDVELTGPKQRLRSTFINGVKEMPIRFTSITG